MATEPKDIPSVFYTADLAKAEVETSLAQDLVRSGVRGLITLLMAGGLVASALYCLFNFDALQPQIVSTVWAALTGAFGTALGFYFGTIAAQQGAKPSVVIPVPAPVPAPLPEPPAPPNNAT